MNGIIVFAYILAAVVTVFASYKVIQRYQKALKRLMMSGENTEPDTEIKPNSIFKQVTLKLIYDKNDASIKAKSVEKKKWQTFTIYLIAYLIYVFVYSVMDLVNTGNSLSFQRIIFWVLIISPPLILLYINIFISDPKKETNLLLKLLGTSFFSVTIWQYLFSTETPTFGDAITVFLKYNALPLLITFLFRLKKIKGISLTLSIFSFLSILVVCLIINYFGKNDSSLKTVSGIIYDLGLRGIWARIAFFMPLILIGVLIAWQVLRIFRHYYNQHKITQLQLFADAYLLIFGICHASISASVGNSAYIIYLIAFATYKFVSIFLFRMNNENQEKSTKLLYLRVFDLGEKTENLFKAIETEWRFAGPTQLITGPDLAHTTVEPHEIISYLAGNLKESFSTNNIQVEKNLENIYLKPLFDASYQTNEMFCDAVHWKNVLTGLVKKTDVVLMDLRSFDKKYAGCIFEIKQLCYLFDLKKCVFVVDKSTNYTYLEETFKDCFAALPVDSPNALGGDVSVNLFEVDTLDNEKAKGLFNYLASL